MFQREHNYSLAVIQAEFHTTNFIQIAYVTKLKGIDVIEFLRCYLYHMINTIVLRIFY